MEPLRTHPSAPRSHRKWKSVVLGLVVLILVARASIDPLAHHFTQRGLDKMDGYRGRFSNVTISIFALTYTIEDLRITRVMPDGNEAELFSVSEAYSRVLWRNLFDGTILGFARLRDARLQIVLVPEEEKNMVSDPTGAEDVEAVAKDPPKPWVLDDAIQSVIPFKLERIELLNGFLRIVDETTQPTAPIEFPNIEAVVENFTTRRALEEGQPMTVAARAGVQQSGELSFFLTFDPLAEELTFRGEAKLLGLQLEEIREYLRLATDGLVIPHGQLDCYTAFHCEQGHLTGAVKSLLKNPDVEAATDEIVSQLSALLTGLGLRLFSDRVPGREAAATIVPFDGHITGPEIALWPTVLTLLRNAFVVGLAESFRGLDVREVPK